jgi:hypothetical protein
MHRERKHVLAPSTGGHGVDVEHEGQVGLLQLSCGVDGVAEDHGALVARGDDDALVARGMPGGVHDLDARCEGFAVGRHLDLGGDG